MFIYAAIYNRKRKPGQFSLRHLSLAHRANGSLLFAHLFTKKQKEIICLQPD
jgi:hypothetical protein